MKPNFATRLSNSRHKWMLVVALVAILPVSAIIGKSPLWAQNKTTGYGAQAGQLADYIAGALKSLDLTGSQKASLKAVAQKYAPQVRAVVNNPSLTSAQKTEQLQAIRASAKTEVDAILTPAQQKKLAVLKTVATGQVKALVTRIAAELKLTPDQRANIKTIVQNARFAGVAILTDESASRSEKRTSIMALRTKTRGEIAAILTPDQQSQAAAIANQIRPELQKRFLAWRRNREQGMGLGLMP